MEMALPEPNLTVIPAYTRRRAMDWSLVLASQDIGTKIIFAPDHRWALLVDPPDYDRAMQAISLYQEENRHWKWRRQLPWSKVSFHWGAVPACVLLAFIHGLRQEIPVLRLAWVFDTAAVREGQWWRAFTAILLHGDLAHLVANVTSGVLLFGLVMARFGPGCGLLGAYIAGALGNVAGLYLHGRPYMGLGASGMVMGALGMLAFHSFALWRTNPISARGFMRGAVAGVFLFLILGVDPRSDVIAHFGGFVAGGAIGAALSFVPEAQFERRSLQSVSWVVLIATFLGTALGGLMKQ